MLRPTDSLMVGLAPQPTPGPADGEQPTRSQSSAALEGEGQPRKPFSGDEALQTSRPRSRAGGGGGMKRCKEQQGPALTGPSMRARARGPPPGP
mmetsp:Transcript_128337/g.273644  ORF Transcript_128337/g.273644 Transcript_128337/m.273644 type:complete len:94 (+) Transcript_128337:51-332(+)